MTPDIDADLVRLSAIITELRRDTAKILAAMQFGGQRQDDQATELGDCKKRAKALSPQVEELHGLSVTDEARARLEKDASFLAQLQAMGASA